MCSVLPGCALSKGYLEMCILKLRGEVTVINIKIEIEAMGISKNVSIYLLCFHMNQT